MNIKIIDEPRKALGNSFGNLVIRFAIVKFNDVQNNILIFNNINKNL